MGKYNKLLMHLILVSLLVFALYGCGGGSTQTNTASSDSDIVYITRAGKKYHSAGCIYLNKSKISITLKKAKQDGYTPCSKCNPPQ